MYADTIGYHHARATRSSGLRRVWHTMMMKFFLMQEKHRAV
jgi:hypothetical protein